MESMGILHLNICRALKKKADEHENLGEFRKLKYDSSFITLFSWF